MVRPPVLFAPCSLKFSAYGANSVLSESTDVERTSACGDCRCMCTISLSPRHPKRSPYAPFRRRSLMHSCLRVAVFTGCMLLSYPAHASHFHRGPTSRSHKTKHAYATSHARASAVHPRAIDDARASEIQTALVKAGYLETASGKWDGPSADAMRKLQGDNGWQTKLIPDSRALIKLGLGPGAETASPGGSGGGLSEVSKGTLGSGAAVPSRR